MSWREYGLDHINIESAIMQTIGISALILSLVYRIPQIYEIYKTKRGDDISTYMLIIQNVSYLLYIAYGVFVHDWIYIASSVLSFLQNILVYFMKKYYYNKRQLAATQLGDLSVDQSDQRRDDSY